jgi:hypothetical protein
MYQVGDATDHHFTFKSKNPLGKRPMYLCAEDFGSSPKVVNDRQNN